MSEEQIIATMGDNNCGGRCRIYAHVRDGKIERLTTDCGLADGPDAPLTACARGLNYHTTFLNDRRLLYPMKRVGERGSGQFQRISWDEAIDTIAREWIRIRDAYGPQSRYVHYAWGISGLVRGNNMAERLLDLDGGRLAHHNSYSTACITYATQLMYGTANTGNTREDLLNSRLIILWGHNPQETQFDHQMHILQQAKKKGIPIVCIDPRRSATAKALDAEWIGLRPATDAALAAGMAYVIMTENRYDADFVRRCCMGFTADTLPEGVPADQCYFAYLSGEQDGVPKTPQWAEAITGVPAQTIVSLARRYAQQPAALIQGYGAQRHANGEQAARSGIMLACLTGNVGIRGGWASGSGYRPTHHQPQLPPVRGPVNPSIPCFLWTDAILRGHEMTAEADGVKNAERLTSDIKMILNLAGNALINQHSDINRTAEILRDTTKCEFIVVSDLFMTASAKFADILLPGTSFLEGENITKPWDYGNFLGYCNRVVEPLGECRFEYDWLKEVSRRLGLYEAFTAGHETTVDWLRDCYEQLRPLEPELPDFETFRREGGYSYRHTPEIIAFADQRADVARHPFPTKSGRVEIFSPEIWSLHDPEKPALPTYVPAFEGHEDPRSARYPLQLIGWHTKRRCHSIGDNNPRLEKLDPQRVWMHPADADARGIREGDLVEVFNDRGRTRVPAHISEDLVSGVAALSQGAWFRPDDKGVDTNGSINVLTTLRPTPLAKGNPQHSNLVEIQKVEVK